MTETSWEVTLIYVTAAATYLSASQVRCTLPDPTGSYAIEIANDRVTFTDVSVKVITIATTCYDCNFLDFTCTRKVGVMFLIIEKVQDHLAQSFYLGDIFIICFKILYIEPFSTSSNDYIILVSYMYLGLFC